MKQTNRNQLHRNNPFYLVSAVCMLVGCLAQSRALAITNFDWTPLAGLIGVLLSNGSGIVPETARELGFTGIVAAFAFLGLGPAFSLWKPSPPSDAPPSAPRARKDPPRRPTRVY